MLSGMVYTDKLKCEACSACLRGCESKSIRIKDKKAEIIEESCLNCGHCVVICSKGAKEYADSIRKVIDIVASQKTAAVLAPSYVIVAEKKYRCTPGQFCSALRQLGFELVYEASFGADIVTKVYAEYIGRLVKDRGKAGTHVITSPCPAIMNYVEKHVPSLIEEFAPILSPMAAEALLVRKWNVDDIAVVGINPCPSKKSELLDPGLGLFDEDMTFEELIKVIDARGIIPSDLEESDFDGIQAFYGAGFPISGGLTKTLELFSDQYGFNVIGNDILIVEGSSRSIEFLQKMAKKKENGGLDKYPMLLDILYCEGCIAGKAMGIDADLFERRRVISEYTQSRFKKARESDITYKGYSLLVKNTAAALEFKKWMDAVESLIAENSFIRTWDNKYYQRLIPNEAQFKYILESDGKVRPEDELNCGACGYHTCRDRAIAVFNEENELGGCIVHIKHEAKLSHEENVKLHELDKMKSDFLSTVSHELRTPLTSVLGFAKIIKKRLEENIFSYVDAEDKKASRSVKQIKENIDIIIS